MRRRSLLLVLASIVASMGAVQRTPNFVVNAPTPQIAAQVGQYAELYRKEKALLWLGVEMPPWPQPCPLHVTISMEGPSGATSFHFGPNAVLGMKMEIKGPLDRLLASVLPHEVTHTVFAYHFRCPVPRWADEGGSVLSEDEQERNRHDQLVRQILKSPGRAIPLKRLFSLTQYPRDVMVLYAEGYSVTNFLVGKSNRGAFLNFIGDGMRRGWDVAAKAHYGFGSVEELEQAWLQYLRDGKSPPTTLASAAPRPTVATPMSRVVVRQTLPPAVPMLGAPRPVARGVAAGPEEGTNAAGLFPPAPDNWAAPSAAPPSAPPPPGPPAVHLGP